MKRLALLLCGLTALHLAAQPISGTFGDLATVDVRPPTVVGAFSPTDISGLVRWHDAQTISASDGDLITTWTDLTGTTNLQARTAGLRPRYHSSNATFGNKPCLHFDGTQCMGSWQTADATRTVFIVGYRTNTVNGTLGAVGEPNTLIVNATTAVWQYYGEGIFTNGNALASGVLIWNFASTSSSKISWNGSAWSAANPYDLYGDGGVFEVGARANEASPINAFVGEILVYDSNLSDADSNSVGNYLAARWNFTWTNL